MTAERKEKATFNPGFYDIASMEQAKGVILGPEPHETVEQRWERETPYLYGLIRDHIPLLDSSLVLDYGCGVGRLSKEIIKHSGCRVVGVDYSTNMRAFAANYTDTPKFMACDAEMLPVIGLGRFDAAITIWVLQHCINPVENIRQIWDALRPNGLFFVLNDLRLIPTDKGFMDDHLDVTALLNENFHLLKKIELSSTLGKDLAPRSYCALYQKLV